MSSKAFLDKIEQRRTHYQLKSESPIPNSRIQEVITKAILHVPSSFNSQSTRIVLLIKEEHEKLWSTVADVLQGVVPSDAFAATEKKLNGFKSGYATILFFDDTEVVKGMQQKFALYADKFPIWATESNAMHQFVIWTALEAEGFGANLQHYNPLINEKVAAEWKLPMTWALKSQLVIGTSISPPGQKTFQPVEERFRVFGG